jgi:hypothetical protein
MDSKSTFSQNMDPYRAGIEIAEAFQNIDPEIIFLFSSIHYNGSEELAEAIYDVLDDKLLIIGCSGDGFYERDKVANLGVSALAINSNGAIHWQLDQEKGVGLTPYETTSRCIRRLEEACPKAQVFFLFSDFRTDASEVIRAITDSSDIPVVGGMAGDDFDMERCFVYINRRVVTDTVVLLALSGDFPFEIFTVHNKKPEGKMGIITQCQDTTIQTINDLPAMHFVEKAMGKPLEHMDTGTITVNVIHPDNPQIMRHRSLLLSKNPEQDTDIQLFGGMAEGEKFQLCLTNPEQIIAEVQTVAAGFDQLPFQPTSAIVISCAGRKQLLGNKNDIEITALTTAKKMPEAIVGFPSLGEISPIKIDSEYTQALFHNMTYVVFVLGENEK